MNAKSFIFGFVVGGALSGVSVYLFAKKKFEKEKKEIVDTCEDTIVKIRQYYSEKVPEKAAIIKEEPSEIVGRYEDLARTYDTRSEEVVGDKIIGDPAEFERPEDDAPEEYYEEGPDPEEARAESYGREADRFDKENRGRSPERIIADDFGNAPGFESKEYTYYVEDNTYCDEFENILDDEMGLFGTAVGGWDTDNEDDDPIYIRNYALNCDFKIDKMFCKCPMNPEAYE